MLSFINELPNDKPISGVHCIPVLPNGNLLLVWDTEEQVLTTIGGRIEGNESIFECLNREAFEEAGLELDAERIPFASWYWTEFKSYRIYYLAKIKRFLELTDKFEKSGYIITNFKTAIEMIKKVEGREERIRVIRRAGELSGQLKKDDNNR